MLLPDFEVVLKQIEELGLALGIADGIPIKQRLFAEDLEDVESAATVLAQTSGDGVRRIGVDAPDRQDDDERFEFHCWVVTRASGGFGSQLPPSAW